MNGYSHSNTDQQQPQRTFYSILAGIAFTHLINDIIQSIAPAIYPFLKEHFKFSFTQIGLLSLSYQVSASILQPVVGLYSDKRNYPYLIIVGMGFTLVGLSLFALTENFYGMVLAVFVLGIGSAIFHPEAARISYMAAGNKRGLAQSIFQLGGTLGSSIGPLLVTIIIIPYTLGNVAWFSVLVLGSVLVFIPVGKWLKQNMVRKKKEKSVFRQLLRNRLSRKKINRSLLILLILISSKFVYQTCMINYYTFYLINKFGLSVKSSQYFLSIFLIAIAVGTIIGGPLGDRYGRKHIIWVSILGVSPFTILFPYVGFTWTVVFSILIGLILSSAFSTILVYGQELLPGKIGMVSGLFFGLAFGISGLSSALIGNLADTTGVLFIFKLCSYTPLLGIITLFLPDLKHIRNSS